VTTLTIPQQQHQPGTAVHQFENIEPFEGFSLVLQRMSWPAGLCLTAELDFGDGWVESAQFAGGQLKGNTSSMSSSGGGRTATSCKLTLTVHQALETAATLTLG
jgi:hypothetical protein